VGLTANALFQEQKSLLNFLRIHHLMIWGYANPFLQILSFVGIVFSIYALLAHLPYLVDFSGTPLPRAAKVSDGVIVVLAIAAFINFICLMGWLASH
jgi:hypothetical protein